MKRYLIILTLSTLIFTQERTTTTGYVYLEDQEDHSGVEILFSAVSGSAVNTTVFSDEDGHYIAGITSGIYNISFSKDGFLPYTIPGEINLFDDSSLPNVNMLSGSVQEVSGTLEHFTHWTADFQYRVMSNLDLNAGDTLIIDPGVDVLFMGYYDFEIRGKMFALGAEGDSIRFTSGQPNKTPGDWIWLKFMNDSADNSYLSYTVVEYGGSINNDEYNDANITIRNSANIIMDNSVIKHSYKNGILTKDSNSSIHISNSKIHSNNQHGVHSYFYSNNSIFENNEIFNNSGHGIKLNYQNNNHSIIGNHIYNNNYGIELYINTNSTIYGNHIHDNYYNIDIDNSSDNTISNNQIYNSTRGIILYQSSNNTFDNNQLYNNSSLGIQINNFSSQNIFSNNLLYNHNHRAVLTYSNSNNNIIENTIFFNNNTHIQAIGSLDLGYNCFYDGGFIDEGGFPSSFADIISVNNNGTPSDTWSNIFMDPEIDENLVPLAGSPLIDAGHPDYFDPDGSISDIGLYYFDQGTTAPSINSITININEGDAPLVVEFTAETEGPIVTREWDFGDGESSTGANPVHLYSTPGVYTVILTVTGPGGEASFMSENLITVYEPVYPPLAEFNANQTTGLIPFTVTFEDASLHHVDSWLWDFGDGNTSDVQHPTYTFDSTGVFSIQLSVTGDNGSDVIIKENFITVLEPEEVMASFISSETEAIAPATISF